MESSAAPSFANLFVGYLEEQHIYPSPLFNKYVKKWMRYIDDIFLIWSGSEDDFTVFVGFLNSIFPGIVFKPEFSRDRISFLDVLITNTHGTVTTSLYTKPTVRNTLLHFHSAHPAHLHKNLLISQFVRVLRIFSDENDKKKQLEIMYQKFLERGYPALILEQALDKVLAGRTRIPSPITRPLFVHTYNQESGAIKRATEHNLNILQSDRSLGPAIRTRPMIAYKRGRTLRDHLVQADPRHKYTKTLPKISQKTGCCKCYNCNVCNSLICGTHFSLPHMCNR